MTCKCTLHSPFRWREHGIPSIFASDRYFSPNSQGETSSQVAVRNLQEREERTGRNPSTIYGISRASDQRAEEFNRQSALKRKRRAGHYSKA